MTESPDGHGRDQPRNASWRRALIKFLFVGAATTLLYFAVLVLSRETFGLATYLSIVIAYVVAVIFNYITHYYWTYRTDRPHRSSMPRYVGFFLIALFINIGLTEFFTSNFDVHYFIVQVSLATFIAAVSFFSQFAWIFAQTRAVQKRDDAR